VTYHDISLLRDIPRGTAVHRAPSIDLAQINDLIYRAFFGRKKKGVEQSATVATTPGDPESHSSSKWKSWVKRFIFSPVNRFVENWIYLPDSKICWFPFAFLHALKIMRKEKPDVIYSTSAPPTAHLIGFALKTVYGLPWVVDFRDNWVVGFAHHYNSRLRVKFDEWLMGRIIKRAERVIAMSQGNLADIQKYYDCNNPGKFHAITNGFDQDDFSNCRSETTRNDGSSLVLLHIGTVYGRTYGRFFHAVAALITEQPVLCEHLKVNFIGFPTPESRQLVTQLNLNKNVMFQDFKSHPEVIKAMGNSDVLLLFLGGEKIMNQQYPGKVFEYMRAERPILALGQPGEITDTLRRSGCGIIVSHDDLDEIKNAIGRLIRRKQSRSLHIKPDHEFINTFEYRNLTSRFTKIMEDACSGNELST